MTECVGILDLSKSYGKLNNKFLYLCQPYDKIHPSLLIPYTHTAKFDKSRDHYYVKYINGIIIHNFGSIDNLSNLYEYLLHSKQLNIPLNMNNKLAIKAIASIDVIEEITNKYNLTRRTGHIFTIDPETTSDFDDAMSVSQNKVSIYISNVSIVLDYLKLWSLLSNRVSTVYLPDKKRSMLPKVIEDICSLTKGEHKICLVLDLYIDDNKHILRKEFTVCNVKISRNYVYEEYKIIKHSDYKLLHKYLSFTNTHDLVSNLMVTFNTECAIQMPIGGIYKPHTIYNPISHNDYISIFKTCSSTPYTTYRCNYLHITSPIRRLVDIFNMYIFTCDKITYSTTAKELHELWILDIDKINNQTCHIKKIQRTCMLHHTFEQNKNALIKGFVFNKDNHKYNVFLPDIHVFTTINIEIELKEDTSYIFKLYMIYDECYKKIQLEFIN